MIWDARNRREDYRIIFRDRGMPNDVSEVRGDEIEVRSDRIVLRDGREIPHHRIIAIWRENELLYIVHER
jgi:uncharacterized protein (UPF0248 family)